MSAKCPVMFAGNCPVHMVVTSPYFSTQGYSHHYGREPDHDAIERKQKEVEARREAKRLARMEELSIRDARRKLIEKEERAAKEAVSKQMQEERRRKALPPADWKEKRLETLKKAQAIRTANAAARRAMKPAKPERMKPPEGWMTLNAASIHLGLSCSTASKYAKRGFVAYVEMYGKRYVDPDKLRIAFSERQTHNLQMYRDTIHKARLARHPFGGTVTE